MKFRITLAALLCCSTISPLKALAAVFHVPSGDVTALIAAINTANATAEADIIQLVPAVYLLQSVETDVRGPTGLPAISSTITIKGESDLTTTIERDTDAPLFRIFHVAAGGILENVTVRGGLLLGVQNGAGIQNFGVTNIKSSSISSNGIVFGVGGGIHSTGTLNVTNSLINRSDALFGAGISSEGNLVMSDSTVSDNVDGGGLRTSGPTTIRNSMIAFNDAFEQAGGIAHSSARLDIVNSTIAHNTSNSFGGAISGSGRILITSSTIIGNNAISGTAIAGTVQVQNTIIANNGRFGSECQGEITSLGNNIVGDALNCSEDLLPSDLTGDPGLGDFTDIEDPGKGHFPLLSTSQAINAGNNSVCPKTDQLGNPREGACDIGSLEFQRNIRVLEELPASEVNVAYSVTFEIIGGVPPYTVEIIKGSLPEGLSLSELTISGVPLERANSNFVIKITDQAGTSANERIRLRVFDAIDINTQSLKLGRVGRPYSRC